MYLRCNQIYGNFHQTSHMHPSFEQFIDWIAKKLPLHYHLWSHYQILMENPILWYNLLHFDHPTLIFHHEDNLKIHHLTYYSVSWHHDSWTHSMLDDFGGVAFALSLSEDGLSGGLSDKVLW